MEALAALSLGHFLPPVHRSTNTTQHRQPDCSSLHLPTRFPNSTLASPPFALHNTLQPKLCPHPPALVVDRRASRLPCRHPSRARLCSSTAALGPCLRTWSRTVRPPCVVAMITATCSAASHGACPGPRARVPPVLVLTCVLPILVTLCGTWRSHMQTLRVLRLPPWPATAP